MSQISSSKSLIYQHKTQTGHNVGFTSVHAGNMSLTVLDDGQTVQDTASNRRMLEDELGIETGTTRFLTQTHSATVLEAGNCGWAEQTTIGEGDAVVSPDGTDPIAILVADCLPVAFTTDYGPTAIAHAGRVGLLAGILENTVQRLKALDADKTGTIKATIGPGICGQCYEVPADMREQAAQRHPKIYAETTWGTPALDLPAAAEAILTQTGVRVHRVDTCTRKEPTLYSHRRQPGSGRIAGIVWKSADSY